MLLFIYIFTSLDNDIYTYIFRLRYILYYNYACYAYVHMFACMYGGVKIINRVFIWARNNSGGYTSILYHRRNRNDSHYK